MSLYKVEYQLKEGEETHKRYYKALKKSTALDMFQQTIEEGSLVGEKPKNISATKIERSINIKQR
jgi:hypothetical protein